MVEAEVQPKEAMDVNTAVQVRQRMQGEPPLVLVVQAGLPENAKKWSCGVVRHPAAGTLRAV